MNGPRSTRTLFGSAFLLGALGSAALASGCASTGGGGAGGGGAFDAITEQEVIATDATDALDMIRRLRPNWLNPIGGEALLYVDNQRRGESGGIEAFLRVQSASSIVLVEWVRPEAAIRLPGAPLTGTVGGAIMVRTRAGG